MNITIQEERYELCIDELSILFPEHYEELALNKDKVPLDPDYNKYAALDEAGKLFIVTIRERGMILGYFVGVVDYHMHYKTTLTCTMDIFYVKQDARGNSLGLKLFLYVKERLKARGVQRWFVGSKCHKDASKLFDYLGFNLVETYHSMWLGE